MTDATYYSINEVAKLLKVAYLTVYRWIQAGKLTAYQVGKQYRIDRSDFETFMQSYKVKKQNKNYE
jgi:excisionase family DNA binding protein